MNESYDGGTRIFSFFGVCLNFKKTLYTSYKKAAYTSIPIKPNTNSIGSSGSFQQHRYTVTDVP